MADSQTRSSRRRRAVMALLLLALLPVALLIDTAIAYAAGWQIQSQLDRGVIILSGLAVLAVVIMAALPRVRAWLARHFPQICAAWLATLVSLVLAELGSSLILYRVTPPPHLRQPHSTRVYHPLPGAMRGIEGVSQTTINSWGLRGPEPPATDTPGRILCLGASTTNCTYLDDTETWPALLQEYLRTETAEQNYWVGNAGIPSLTTTDHLTFLQHSDIPGRCETLILQPAINDFMRAIAHPRQRGPLWLSSRAWQLTASIARRLFNSPAISVEDQAGANYVRRRQQRIEAKKLTTLPPLETALADYERRLHAIVEQARSLGLRVIVTSQPVLWTRQPDPEDEKLLWFGRIDDRYLATAQLRQGMDRFNAATEKVCKAAQVEFIDLSNLTGRPEVFYDDCHFTEEGARQVARQIADYLLHSSAGSQADTTPQAASPDAS